MWSKYQAVFFNSLFRTLQFRAEMLLWFFLDAVPTLVIVAVWMSIYRQGSSLPGLSIEQVSQYYLLGTFINNISASHFETWRVSEIRDGKIDHYFTRPLPYLADLFITHIAAKTLYLIATLPLFLGLWWALSQFMPIAPLVLSPSLLTFAGFVIYAFLIEFLIALMIVLLGFWFEYSAGLEHFKWIIITLFSGMMMPLAFMPHWLRTLTELLPFKYLYATPIGLWQGTATLSVADSLYAGGFLLVLVIIVGVMWRKAVYQYTSAGG